MSKDQSKAKPILCYSDCEERAHLLVEEREDNSMPRRGRKGRSKNKRGKRQVGVRRSKVRVVKGRVGIKLGGFKGLQYLSASELVRHLPLNRIKVAARKILRQRPKLGSRKLRKQRRKGGRKAR